MWSIISMTNLPSQRCYKNISSLLGISFHHFFLPLTLHTFYLEPATFHIGIHTNWWLRMQRFLEIGFLMFGITFWHDLLHFVLKLFMIIQITWIAFCFVNACGVITWSGMYHYICLQTRINMHVVILIRRINFFIHF